MYFRDMQLLLAARKKKNFVQENQKLFSILYPFHFINNVFKNWLSLTHPREAFNTTPILLFVTLSQIFRGGL